MKVDVDQHLRKPYRFEPFEGKSKWWQNYNFYVNYPFNFLDQKVPRKVIFNDKTL